MPQIDIPAAHREWAKLMRSRVGGSCGVVAYDDDPRQRKIHIFTSSNEVGSIAATVGLMDIPLGYSMDVELRSEVMMERRGQEPRLANILATIAFYVMKDGWRIAPGIVFEDMVSMYIPETRLPHVIFAEPWLFDGITQIVLSDRTIFPLVAIPISEAESKLAGRDLKELWRTKRTDVLDWDRPSAL